MRLNKRLVVALLACMATVSGVYADSVTIDRERLAACANTVSLIARAGCYDKLAKAILADAPSSSSAPANRIAATTTPDPASFGRSDAEKRKQLQSSLGVREAAEISAGIAGVRRTPHGKLLVTLDNGQVWRQLDSAKLPLGEGESVRIERAGLGSYLLQKQAGSRTIRVRRVD